MLIGNLQWFAVAASVAFLQTAEAAPIRVTVVSHQEWLQPIGDSSATVVRFGHVMAGMDGKMGPGAPGPIVSSVRKPCPMHRGGSKEGSSLSDSVMKALGLRPVEHQPIGHIHLKPDVAMPTAMVMARPVPPMRPSTDGSWYHDGTQDDTFLRRLHAALMALDTWEARAVAFVLGCGIGVLLRMLWVFFVLIGRGLREDSTASQDAEYTLVLQDEEQLPRYEAQPPTAVQVEQEKALFKALEDAALI
jgi:hypothetical protein